MQEKKKLKNRNNNNNNPSIAPFFFVEWKRRKIHHSLTRDPIERKNPLELDERSDREKSALTLTRSREGQQNSQVRRLKFQNLNFVPCSCSSSPGLEKKERGRHTDNTSLTPFFKSNETGVRFSKPVYGKKFNFQEREEMRFYWSNGEKNSRNSTIENEATENEEKKKSKSSSNKSPSPSPSLLRLLLLLLLLRLSRFSLLLRRKERAEELSSTMDGWTFFLSFTCKSNLTERWPKLIALLVQALIIFHPMERQHVP